MIRKMINTKYGLLDNRRSCITKKQIKKYRTEITKLRIVPLSTFHSLKLAKAGSCNMKEDSVCLIQNTLEV